MPSSACRARCEPSNTNGRVTTPTVSAPISFLAISAIDGRGAGAGAAALAGGDEDHVRALERFLDLVARLGGGAVADVRVGAGAEALRELVADVELDVGVAHRSAWASVFAAMNSTPRRPASTMRLTAFVPPPPTPTTLMTAR